MPLRIGELEHRRARAMTGAVDQHIDAAPALQGEIDEALQIVVRLIRPGRADAAELRGQRLALARRGEDRDLEPLRRQLPRRRGAHAAAAGGYDRDLLGHRLLLALVLLLRPIGAGRAELTRTAAAASKNHTDAARRARDVWV